MLQLVNATPFTTHRTVLLSQQGSQVWTVCIKGTYRFDMQGHLKLHESQEPVALYPTYSGEPGQSSLLRDGEVVVDHPGTAVTLNASAHAPGGRATPTVEVGVVVGRLQHRLRVVGDRSWQRGRRGRWEHSDARPFVTLPICYERAFGGADPATGIALASNPVGTGHTRSVHHAAGLPLPNIEFIDAPPPQPDSAMLPAGFGAIAPGWSPRRELAGTADEEWAATRAPLWPADWSPWHHNAAPPALQSAHKLKGGEPVTLTHLASISPLTFSLPRVFFDVRTRIGGRFVANEVGLDRVIIEPDQQRLVMVWRCSLDCGPDARRVEVTYVDTKTDLRTGRKDGAP